MTRFSFFCAGSSLWLEPSLPLSCVMTFFCRLPSTYVPPPSTWSERYVSLFFGPRASSRFVKIHLFFLFFFCETSIFFFLFPFYPTLPRRIDRPLVSPRSHAKLPPMIDFDFPFVFFVGRASTDSAIPWIVRFLS